MHLLNDFRNAHGFFLIIIFGTVLSTGSSAFAAPNENGPSAERNAPEKDEQDANTVSYGDVQPGDRVKLLLDNENTFQGLVSEKSKNELILDVSYEQVEITGTITFDRSSIARIHRLDPLSKQRKQTMQQKKKQYMETVWKQRRENTSENGEETSQSGSSESKAKKEGPSLEQLRNQFPEKTWGQERYSRVKSKFDFQRTPKEKQFLEHWEKIQKARAEQERKSKQQILETFPPEKWGKERYESIKNKRGANPGRPVLSDKEMEFLKKYDRWKTAYEERKKEKSQNEGENEKATSTDQETASGTGNSDEQQTDGN